MVKLALIGLGIVAEQLHLPACESIPEIEVAAACDVDEARARAVQTRFKIPAIYTDAAKMLTEAQPDIVIVATPPHTHHAMCVLALQPGAHVLCEKPFMSSVAEADDVIAQAKTAGRLLRVNTQYRYMPVYRETQQRLAAGEFGRLFFAQCWQQMFHPPNMNPTAWRADLKQSALYEFGAHPLDLLCYLFDSFPVAVAAVIPTQPAYESDVLVHLTLHFPEQRFATLVLNRISHAPERYLEMRLDCENSSLRLSYGGLARAGVQMQRYQGSTRPSLRLSYVRGGEARAERGWSSQPYVQERQFASSQATAEHLRVFLREMGGASLESAFHAREILRLTFAAYDAAQRQTVVSL